MNNAMKLNIPLPSLAAWALALMTLPMTGAAQTFPAKPIRLVVPFPAGGGTDTIARALGEGLAKELGQPIVVDNKAGAGTVIGNDAVAKSPPDGHTLLLNTSAISIVASLFPKLPYASDSAFEPVILLGRAPVVAVVRADSPLKSGRDFLAQARAQPGRRLSATARASRRAPSSRPRVAASGRAGVPAAERPPPTARRRR